MIITIDQVVEAIRNHGGLSEGTQIDLNAEFKSLGIDSLDVFDILMKIETITGAKIPDEDVVKLTSAAAIFEYFNSKN